MENILSQLSIKKMKKRWPDLMGHAVVINSWAIGVYLYTKSMAGGIIEISREPVQVCPSNHKYNFERIARAARVSVKKMRTGCQIKHEKIFEDRCMFWIVRPGATKA
jgi:hypothetical protein